LGNRVRPAVCTFLVTPAVLALLVLGAAQRSVAGALWVGAAYGATRGLAMLLFTVLVANGRHHSPEALGNRVVARTRLPVLVLMIGATASSLLTGERGMLNRERL